MQIKNSLNGTAAAGFSLADVIALAPAYGLSKMGGGAYPMKVGRLDASGPDPDFSAKLPSAADSVEELKASFAQKGLNVRDLVALSGSHTVCPHSHSPAPALLLYIPSTCVFCLKVAHA